MSQLTAYDYFKKKRNLKDISYYKEQENKSRQIKQINKKQQASSKNWEEKVKSEKKQQGLLNPDTAKKDYSRSPIEESKKRFENIVQNMQQRNVATNDKNKKYKSKENNDKTIKPFSLMNDYVEGQRQYEQNKKKTQEYENTSTTYKTYEKERQKSMWTQYFEDLDRVENEDVDTSDKINVFRPFVSSLEKALAPRETKLKNGESVNLPSYNELKTNKVMSEMGMVGQAIHGASSSLGHMAPSMLASAIPFGIGKIAGPATTFATTMNSAQNEKLLSGYTPKQARQYALVNASLETGLQNVLGGLTKITGGKQGFLQKNLDKVLNKIISNPGGRRLLSSAGSELVEEELQNLLDPVNEHITLGEYKTLGEALSQWDWDEATTTALSTLLTVGLTEGPTALKVGNMNKQIKNLNEQYGTDFKINTDGQIQDGKTNKKLTGAEVDEKIKTAKVAQLQERQLNDIEQRQQQASYDYQNGNITEEQYNKELEQISNELKAFTEEQNNNETNPITEIEADQEILQDRLNNSEITEKQYNSEMDKLNARLREISGKPERYQYTPGESESINKLEESASKYFDNSEKSRNYIEMLKKISTDKGLSIIFDDSIGDNINGQYQKGVITINPNSNRAGEFIAIHELTHAIGTEQMKSIIETYRRSNTEFDQAVKSLMENYDASEINEEAMADVAGQLFGNQEFINNIAETNPSLFQRIYKEIKYLYHQFRGYKNQNQFIEDLQYKWEQAYRNNKVKIDSNANYSKSLGQRVNGDELLDAQDLIEEIKSVGAEVDENGYVTLYHQTTSKNAEKIKETGQMTSKEDGVFFSTSKDAQQAEDRGTEKLEFKIPAEVLTLDDIFSDNADVKIKMNGKNSIDVAEYLVSLDNNINIEYNKDGIYIKDKNEYGSLQDTVKYLQSQKLLKNKGTDFIENGNYFYAIKSRSFGDFKTIVRIKIEGNEGLIDTIKGEYRNGINKNSKTIDSIIKSIENDRNSGDWNNVDIKERTTTEQINRLYNKEQRESDRRDDNEQNGRVVRELDNSSFSYDNAGRELSKGQQEYFKDSKVRNESGNLEVVYHQTNADFTEFKNGFSKRGFKNANFFTNQKPNKILKNLMEGYVAINKPLYLENVSINQSIVDKAIQDGYDGIINQNVQGIEGKKEIITFESKQFKNTNNINPTPNSDIRYSKNTEGMKEYLNKNLSTKDNSGRKLSKKQQEYFKDSKARDNDGNLITVYHTTTNEGTQFNEFNPVGTEHYRFGDQVVNYYTDSKDMSGSYASQDYIMADTKKITSMKEVEDYIKTMNILGWGSQYNYELVNEDGKYKLVDNSKLPNSDKTKRQIYDEANEYKKSLTEKELKQFKDMFEHSSEFQSDGRYNIDSYLMRRGYDFGSEEDKTAQKYLNINNKNYEESGIYWDVLMRNAKYHTVDTFNSEEDLFRNIKNRGSASAKRQYEGYVNITNPYIVDAEKRNWNQVISQSNEFIDELEQRVPQDVKNNLTRLYQESANKSAEARENYEIVEQVIRQGINGYQSAVDEEIKKANQVVKKVGFNEIEQILNDTQNIGVNPWYNIAEALQDEGVIGSATKTFIIDEFKLPKQVKEWLQENYNKGIPLQQIPTNNPLKLMEQLDRNATPSLKDIYNKNAQNYEEFDKYRMPNSYFMEQISSEGNDYLGNELNDIFETRSEIYSPEQVGEEIAQASSVAFSKPELIRLWGTSKTTNDVVKEIIASNRDGKTNYDGVIIKNVYDYGGKSATGTQANDLYITFNSNQFKAVDNINPTKDADIRYSQNNQNWREYLEKNYKTTGTRTNFADIVQKTKPQQQTANLEKMIQKPIAREKTTNNLTQEEQNELKSLREIDNAGIAGDTELNRIEYLENKQKGNIKFAELKPQVEFKDISREYGKFKRDIGDFNPRLLNKAMDSVDGYRNTRTKDQWLDVAENIGSNYKGNAKGLKDYAVQSWFQAKPNMKENLNRQGQKYVKFSVDEWVNSVYKGAGVGEISSQVDTQNNIMQDMTKQLKDQQKAIKDITTEVKEAVNPIKHSMESITKQIDDIRETLNLPKRKIMNPVEIAKLTKADASTTTKLADKKVSTGKGESSFANNILNKTDMLTDFSKEKILSELGTKYYKQVTNEDSMSKALDRLEEGGASETLNWFQKASDNADSTDVAEGWILMKQYQDTGDYDGMVQVAKKMREIGTKAGQTVQAFNIMERLTPEGMVKYAQSELSEAYDQMIKNKTKAWIDEHRMDFELTGQEVQFILDTMNEVSTMEDGYDKKVKLAEIQKIMTDKLPADKNNAIKSWMRISMLFNPKTQVRNVVGNAIIAPVNYASDIFASAVDKAISKKTNVRTTGTINVKAVLKGFKEGAYQATNDYKRGINTKDMEGNRFEIGEGKTFSDKTLIGKSLNRVDSLLNYVMDAGDRIFSQSSFENSLQNQMILNNTTEVTQDMIDIARNESLSRTWNDNNNYTRFVLNVRKMMNTMKIGGYGVGDILIPFAKTPANLTKAIVDYSPAGLINTLIQGKNLKRSIENGQYTPQMQHQFVQSLGKATAGTMLYVLGYALAKSGVISGESDDDKDTANFLKNTLGVNSYSIKIGGKSFTYDWAQPISAPLSIMANIVNSKNKNKEQALLEGIVGNLDTAGSILMEQSFMQSLNEVLTNNDGVVSGLVNQILQLPARAIPTFMKQLVDLTDSTQRTSYEYGKPVQSAINAIKAKIPGLSTTLAPSVDTMGREIKRHGGKNNIFNVFLNPANVSTENISTSAEEIYRLYQQTGDKTIMPRVAPYYINSKGQKITFTSKEKAEFQKISGGIVETSIQNLLNDDTYQSLSDTDKADVINNLVNYSYNKAQMDIAKTPVSSRYKNVTKYVNSGGDPGYYYLHKKEIDYQIKNPSKYNYIKQITSYDNYQKYTTEIKNIREKYKNATTATRKAKTISYINSLDLSAVQKAMLIRKYYTSYNSYNSKIYNYVNQSDLSASEKLEVYKELGFKVKGGRVRW